jgi:hypothetical protein
VRNTNQKRGRRILAPNGAKWARQLAVAGFCGATLREPSPLVMHAALLYPVVSMKEVFQDDLPSISVSRFRATGAITAEMTKAMISIGDVSLKSV